MTSPETLELEAVDAALAGRYVAPEHAELADLALLLRDEKPEPEPAWANRLDRRAEAGFPAPPRRRYVWLRKAAPAIAIAVCLLPVAVVAALIEPGGNDEGEAGGGMIGATSDDSAPSAGSAGGASEESAQPLTRTGGGPGTDSRPGRHQERSASLILAVPRREIDEVAGQVADVTTQLGGFVARSSISSTDGGALLLRVPTDRLDGAIERLSKLGRVRDLSRQSVDITASVVSARERLRDARTEREALLEQLAEADTVNETESIRERLDIVSREIASARRQVRRVNNRASFADVSVDVVPRGGGDEEGGAWTPGDAFDDALRVLEVAAGVLVVAAAVLLPLTLIWLLAWLARRVAGRRRRERALDMA